MISLERLLLVAMLVLFGLNAAKADLLEKTSPGRAPKGLKMKSSKVPTFEIHKAKNIPRLDVGEEASFRAGEGALILPAAPTTSANNGKTNKPASPTVVNTDLRKQNLPSSGAAKNVVSTKDPGTAPGVNALAIIADPESKPSSVDAKKLDPLSPAESRLLEAQIVLEKHDNPATALGLAVELLDDKNVRTEARFTYALAARKLGLSSEFRSIVFKIAQDAGSKDWGRRATETLVREVEALEIPDMKVLTELVDRFDVETDDNDAYNFYRAKYFLEIGNLGQVEDALKSIPPKSKYHGDALLISALSAYRQGDVKKSEAFLRDLLKGAKADESVRSTGAITLARILFQRGEYKEASQAYLQVDKSNALWLQAMVEQAWSQVLSGDHEGAAGNMFSLHTDFFKNAFSPESYIARSVAYLNLCQYGDGMQALNNFKRKYGPLVGRLEKYRSERKAPQDDYETVRTWLKNSDLREVNGLPRSFVIEMARHPSFMRAQAQINAFEDELERFTSATVGLIQLEKDLIRRQSETRDEIQKHRIRAEDSKVVDADTKVRLLQLEAQLAAYKMRYDLAKRARGDIKDARNRAVARIDKEKVSLKERASKALRQRLGTLTAELSHVLEQNEVLQYEILAGAGEHLRAQSAGAELGKKGDRQPAAATDKSVKWSFQGEIWEDEIGHYRSSLKSVCSKDDKIAAY